MAIRYVWKKNFWSLEVNISNGITFLNLGRLPVSSSISRFSPSNADLQLDANGNGAVDILTQVVRIANLPTSDPNSAGQLYNDSGTLKISAG